MHSKDPATVAGNARDCNKGVAIVPKHLTAQRDGVADHGKKGIVILLHYPGRRFACPGLLSYRPSGTSDWLAALANGPNVRMSRREQTLSSRKNVRPGRLHPLGLPGKRFARQTVME